MVKYVNRCMYCIFLTYVWRNAYCCNICTCLFHARMQLVAAHVRFYACTLLHVYTCTYKCLPTFWTDKQVDRQTDNQSVCQSDKHKNTDTQAVDNVHILCRILMNIEYAYFYLCLLLMLILLLILECIRYTGIIHMIQSDDDIASRKPPKALKGIRCRVFFVHLTHKFLFLKMPGLCTFNCMNISTI